MTQQFLQCELAAWILKHEIKKYPSFSETEVAKRA